MSKVEERLKQLENKIDDVSKRALGCLEIVVNIVFFVFRGFAVPAFLCLTLSFS